jgi:hypothetical protein
VAATSKAKTCVWRWQKRFMMDSVEGLLRDKTRPPGKLPVAADRTAEVIRLTLAPLPHEATHWTLRRWPRPWGWPHRLCRGSGKPMALSSRIAGGSSSFRRTRP